MTTRRIVKVKHYRQVPGAPASKSARPTPGRPLLLPLLIGFPVIAVTGLLIFAHRIPNPPNMDLSRRAAFALASLLGLWAAGMIGFALGMGKDREALSSQAEIAARTIARQHRSRLMILCGSILLAASIWLEYMAAFDKMP